MVAMLASVVSITAPCVPSPACRPKVGKWSTYYAPAYVAYKDACADQMALERPQTLLEGDLGVALDIVIQKPKKTVLARPRGDVDNYAKGALDAAKGLLWVDDDQVVSLLVSKRWTLPTETPHIRMTVGNI